MSKTVLIMAGGTGGHIFPALAIANELNKRSANIQWLGSTRGMENSLVPKYGITLHTVSAVGLRGKNLFSLLKAPFLLNLAFFQTIMVFVKTKPDVVLGMGGFASGIGGVVAWMLRIPLVIHEQNSIPGTTNKLLSKIATQTFQAFEHTFDKTIAAITSGNPISFTAQQKSPRSQPLNLLVLGGSLGAKSINEAIPKLETELNIWHQTGKQHLDSAERSYQGKNAKISAFIDDMAQAYAWADIIICRCGAMTISELIATGSVAILIPFPYAIDDHQTENAKILSEQNAGVLLPQTELSAQKLDEILSEIDLDAMSSAINRFKKNDSIKLISDYLIAID
jgi:UDP-N-acetylglucosamine--N-acetylmuramyl-(pentapeptide) pyrophosphoryl-undecaprenol N-acetylglucosamine transferase